MSLLQARSGQIPRIELSHFSSPEDAHRPGLQGSENFGRQNPQAGAAPCSSRVNGRMVGRRLIRSRLGKAKDAESATGEFL